MLTGLGLWSFKGDISSKRHSVVVETIGLKQHNVVETIGLWHFVDVIWIIIFTVVYLFVYAPIPY